MFAFACACARALYVCAAVGYARALRVFVRVHVDVV